MHRNHLHVCFNFREARKTRIHIIIHVENTTLWFDDKIRISECLTLSRATEQLPRIASHSICSNRFSSHFMDQQNPKTWTEFSRPLREPRTKRLLRTPEIILLQSELPLTFHLIFPSYYVIIHKLLRE